MWTPLCGWHFGVQADGALLYKVVINEKVHLEKLIEYLQRKNMDTADAAISADTVIQKFVWQETDEKFWMGEPPRGACR